MRSKIKKRNSKIILMTLEGKEREKIPTSASPIRQMRKTTAACTRCFKVITAFRKEKIGHDAPCHGAKGWNGSYQRCILVPCFWR